LLHRYYQLPAPAVQLQQPASTTTITRSRNRS